MTNVEDYPFEKIPYCYQEWSSDEDTYETLVTNSTIVSEDTTFYAKWESSVSYVARIGTSYFETLQEAITAVPKNTTAPTTITLLKDTDVIVPNKRKYYIENLYDHYKHTMYVEPLDITKEIIEKKYPKYLEEFDKLQRAVIGRKSIFDMNESIKQVEELME